MTRPVFDPPSSWSDPRVCRNCVREGLCDGSLDCKAKVHVHGCWLDHGDCDEPCEHDERVLEIRRG